MACDVGDGPSSLDQFVADLLPGSWPPRLRVRHLVSHTRGLDCAHFSSAPGTVRTVSPAMPTRLVSGYWCFRRAPPISYNNGGFVLAGKVLESTAGRSLDEVLRDRLIEPLGMSHTEVVRERPTNVPRCRRTVASWRAARRCRSPAGVPACSHPRLRLCGCHSGVTAEDLSRFVRTHLLDSRTEVMRNLQVPAVEPTPWLQGPGLAWTIGGDETRPKVRLRGAFTGQSGIVAAEPASGDAVVMLTYGSAAVHALLAWFKAADQRS
ncbi:serine hydrolase [Streptomyces noursei]|uniref:serine hydrolase domain-containing protein n=1 Tax=Streptomyces noursei TaxID=1971 RepID=UPI0021A4C69D|nr:serine hydrolase [Streptomyces noursei]UWS76978.1 serine hydrolase [Streptomyces noursei]UWS77507.1 serine hydrolase [Streptomyces noursei]